MIHILTPAIPAPLLANVQFFAQLGELAEGVDISSELAIIKISGCSVFTTRYLEVATM